MRTLGRLAALLLILFAVRASATPACGSPEADAEVRARYEKARGFFMRSLAESLERLKRGRPIQVDLYVPVHFLLYNDELGLEPDPAAAARWREKIVRYFASTLGRDTWETEGCVTVKLLAGMRLTGADPAVRARVAAFYAGFIHRAWRGAGVGECLSSNVIRTYGSDSAVPLCGPVIRELVAKTAYYEALAAGDPEDPMARVPLPTLNERFGGPLEAWADVVPEEWVIKAYQTPGQKLVSRKRFLQSKRTLAEGVAAAPLRKQPTDTMYLSPLLYESWLAGNPVDEKGYALLGEVLAAQQDDGRVPSSMSALRSKGHNIDATPTYMAMLAMKQYLRARGRCAAPALRSR